MTGGFRLRQRRTAAAVSTPAPAPVLDADAIRVDGFVRELVARAEPPHLEPIGPVTGALYDRLLPEDLVAVEAALIGAPKDLWQQMTPEHRKVLAPIFAVLYEVPGAMQRTGLVRAAPPDDVHTMARGPLTYGGDPSIADLVVRVFDEAEMGLPQGGTVLDFGCSSGRVVRVLSAYRPDLEWLGCDPNGDAITWATENLPTVRFFTSPTAPPLDLEAGSVDRVYAISICRISTPGRHWRGLARCTASSPRAGLCCSRPTASTPSPASCARTS